MKISSPVDISPISPDADFILAQRVEDAAPESGNDAAPEYDSLAPLFGPSREIIAARLTPRLQSDSPDASAPAAPLKYYQWTLKELGVITVFASVGLAGASWMPAAIFAGLIGVVTILAIFCGSVFLPDARKHRAVYFGFFCMYALAILSACFQP